ncbi:phage portal protein [Clostridium celatum]|uniref:phage portal protein n=1 Tax=Clostridium celatum TaxID=36834 RepID=UPI00290449A5|nr:phage portal protein [Clostridium celatum]MDU2266687.1 phage portal protein [Clostridium celatum]MDU6297068.1 phage portal protein [Clostridium celatum]
MFEKLFEKRSYTGENSFDWSAWIKGEDDDFTGNDSTYSKCINLFSENIAKLPIVTKIKTEKGDIDADNFYLYELLRLRPNTSMNAFECIKSLVAMTKHYGSAGLYIDRDKGLVKGLYPVRINQFIVDNAGLINSTKNNKVLVDFTCGDVSGSCFEKDIIILRDNSINGIDFRKTKSYIKDSIDTNIKAQKYQSQLFSNGLTNKIVVQLTSDIKEEKELKKVQGKFDRMYSNNGRVFTVPAGYNVSAMNLSLADSQFAELKIIGKQDITSAIGVPYSLIEKGSLSEEETIAFLSNAIIPIITALEQEMDWKLLTLTERKQGYKIRFNVNAMLRTSPEKQSVILDRYVKDGIYTINDCKRILGVPLVKGGDIVTLPSGQITLENLIAGNATWQKSTAKGGENDENGENQD